MDSNFSLYLLALILGFLSKNMLGVDSCRTLEEGCASHIPCCRELQCDKTDAVFGHCRELKQAPTDNITENRISFRHPSSGGSALISKEEFIRAVTVHGYPAPTEVQYNNVITRATPAGKITTKRELAMFLANILHESDGLRAKEEYNPQEYTSPDEDKPGKKYHGRGYTQLTWAKNYKAASLALHGDLRLWENPEQVSTDDRSAWDTAFWYWSAHVHDAVGVSEGRFGVAIQMINGAKECKPGGTFQARKRFEMYQKIFKIFRVDGTPDDRGCY